VVGLAELASLENPAHRHRSREAGAPQKLAGQHVELVANAAAQVPAVAASVKQGEVLVGAAPGHPVQPAGQRGILEVGGIIAVVGADEIADLQGARERTSTFRLHLSKEVVDLERQVLVRDRSPQQGSIPGLRWGPVLEDRERAQLNGVPERQIALGEKQGPARLAHQPAAAGPRRVDPLLRLPRAWERLGGGSTSPL
jgi:hypothetical protein